jgi:hypothetical protein
MIVRSDVTAETYDPIPFSTGDFRHLKKAFRDHAPDLALDLTHTDTGVPFVCVTEPEFIEDALIIIRSERGWQMHRGGDGPLYEFATAQEVAELLGCPRRRC